MTQTLPKLNVGPNITDDFIPEAASYFSERESHEDSGFLNDTGIHYVTGTDADGQNVTLWYFPSNVVVHYATYDKPDSEITATTAPESVEYISIDAWDADSDIMPILDGEPVSLPEDVTALWGRADHIEVMEDYLCATGIDSASPVGQQYDLYFVLGLAFFSDEPETPFFTHETTQEAMNEIGESNQGTEEYAEKMWERLKYTDSDT